MRVKAGRPVRRLDQQSRWERWGLNWCCGRDMGRNGWMLEVVRKDLVSEERRAESRLSQG